MAIGLDEVIAAETVLSEVDGNRGKLIIRGRSLDDLAARETYEGVMAMLFEQFLDEPAPPQHWQSALGAARVAVFQHLGSADAALLALEPIDAMRALVARIQDGNDPVTALHLVAAPAVFTAGLIRLRQGHAPIPPDAGLGHAADILRMSGLPAEAAHVHALDAYLVTVADHGLNASTFASRVVASTRAGLTSSVLAAISALKGPLHGGAPGPVLDMLDAIGTADKASTWLDAALARGDRLMGFGHRIYRVRDPRADALKAALQPLLQGHHVPGQRAELAQTIERIALDTLRRHKPDRALETNVEFYTALLLDALGFDREVFTCIFAMGRVSGWIAHAREQALTGRLIRPQSRYVGPLPEAIADEAMAVGD